MKLQPIGAGPFALRIPNGKTSDFPVPVETGILLPDVAQENSGQEIQLPVEAKEQSKEYKKAVDTLNKTMDSYYTNLRFELHKKSGRYICKVVRSSDGTVVREIPPEKILDMVVLLKDMVGLVVDKFI